MSSTRASLSPAFLTAAPLSLSRTAGPAAHCLVTHVRRPVAPARLSRRAALRMMADEESEDKPAAPAPASEATPSSDGPTTSAAEILKTLRDEAAADMAEEDMEERASRSMLGVYRDVDGRSNVWAVEPQEETDTRPQLSKTVIIAVAAAFIIGALLVLPLLPFTNPDQL